MEGRVAGWERRSEKVLAGLTPKFRGLGEEGRLNQSLTNEHFVPTDQWDKLFSSSLMGPEGETGGSVTDLDTGKRGGGGGGGGTWISLL